MADLVFRSDFSVELVDHMGSDQRIVGAARVSTKGAAAAETGEATGLINYLMKSRHGSPFEHVLFTWRISAPIFVWREFMRHRIASYNEESGRYKQLDPVFYIPHRSRALVQEGKPGHYNFVQGSDHQHAEMEASHKFIARQAYTNYENLIRMGVAKEVARMSLPLNIYSTAYVTMNARALMNFLSLRVRSEESAYPSTPQWEINAVADRMETDFTKVTPLTWAAFQAHGRVAP